MANSPAQTSAQLLRRSLERGRLGHAYLFLGDELDALEDAATDLAGTLNCERPGDCGADGTGLAACGACPNCRRIAAHGHPDVQWIRPAMKTRQISIDSIRELIQMMTLKPAESRHKIGVIVGADRLHEKAANAFLKTLEEPPRGSVLILLSTEPQRILETILSRCLRLNFGGDAARLSDEARHWLGEFSAQAGRGQEGLLGRYRLLSTLLAALGEAKAKSEEQLEAQSPLARFPDAEPAQRERWEDELAGALEAEHRRRRHEFIGALEWWLRDVWLQATGAGSDLLRYADLAGDTAAVAARIGPGPARANIERCEQTSRLLHTNVQEALALEVGLLKLTL